MCPALSHLLSMNMSSIGLKILSQGENRPFYGKLMTFSGPNFMHKKCHTKLGHQNDDLSLMYQSCICMLVSVVQTLVPTLLLQNVDAQAPQSTVNAYVVPVGLKIMHLDAKIVVNIVFTTILCLQPSTADTRSTLVDLGSAVDLEPGYRFNPN